MEIKTAFISDIHLSTFGTKSEEIIHFLQNNEFKTLFIVGDFIDVWRLRVADYWPNIHTSVLLALNNKLKNGTQIIYITGNHDDFFSEFTGKIGKGLEIKQKCIITINNKKLLVMHGHQFDATIIKLLTPFVIIGTWGYDILAWFSKWYNNIRIKMGLEPFSLSSYFKKSLKKITNKMGNYEKNVLKYVRRKRVDGIIYGHTHKPDLKIQDNLVIANTGDWVSNCSFITIDEENKIALYKYDAKELQHIQTIQL
jgi:UDP-2,3-diacylglucosamine pyrophosphatase LpxH